MHFEIRRLDAAEGPAEGPTVVDAATLGEIVEEAAETGERLYIRPLPAG